MARLLRMQGVVYIETLVHAGCFVVVPSGTARVAVGELVVVLPR